MVVLVPSAVCSLRCWMLIGFTTIHSPPRNFRKEPHGDSPVDVVGAGDATLDGAAGVLGFCVGNGLLDGTADREPVCSHSMWTVNGPARSPTLAGDSCCSDRAVRHFARDSPRPVQAWGRVELARVSFTGADAFFIRSRVAAERRAGFCPSLGLGGRRFLFSEFGWRRRPSYGVSVAAGGLATPR
jgi:hypothetical protein